MSLAWRPTSPMLDRKRRLSFTSPVQQESGILSSTNIDGKHQYWVAGRPPWYNVKGNTTKPFIIGVSGGTSSGKTTVCHSIIQKLAIPWAVILSQDSFYKSLNEEEHERAAKGDYNFDHPDAFDYELMLSTLLKLKAGESVEIPNYDFKTHSRLPSTTTVYGADVILFEGILVFWSKQLLSHMDLKIFVHCDSDIRLARRMKRDIAERGRDFDGVLLQYEKFVKPAFDEFIEPTRKKAHIIIPNGSDNSVAIDLITEHIKLKLRERHGTELRMELYNFDHSTLPPTVHVLPSTVQIKGIHTQLRDRNSNRETFVFATTRLTRLLIEEALSFVPWEDHSVTTPTESVYNGKIKTVKMCGVSIMRAGESMEIALREVLKDIRIGKLLIQSHPKTGDPQLIYTKLLSDISQRWVFLMDPMVGTGASAMMAVRVLLDHGVPQNQIKLLTLLCAPQGVNALAYAFPKVEIFTTFVDKDIDKNFHIIPGVGNFGDRYFGTEKMETSTTNTTTTKANNSSSSSSLSSNSNSC